MAITTIKINFPFSFNEKNSQEFQITNRTSVSDIIKYALPDDSFNPDDYGIYIRPHNRWLLPDVLLKSYIIKLTSPQATYEFRSRILRIVKINVLFNQITTYCDPRQSVGIVIKNAISKLIPSYASAEFSAENISNGIYFDSLEPISHVFESSPSENIPTIRARTRIPKSMNSTLIFKGTIDNALERENHKVSVPSFFTKLLELIDNYRDSVGIYRISGDFTTIEDICNYIENSTNEEKLNTYLSKQKPNELACVVKQYLRQLSEPVIPLFFEKDFRDVISIGDFVQRIQKLKVLVKSLPLSHYSLFSEFCKHIERIIQSPVNQMGSKNLAICIGTNIIRAQNPATIVQDTQSSQLIVQTIFENWRYIFLDEDINLDENKGTIICDVTDEESGKSIEKDTKIIIVNKSTTEDGIWTVKSGNTTIKTSSKNVKMNDPRYIPAFDDFIPFGIDLSISDSQYLTPDDTKHTLSNTNLNKIIEQKILEAQKIESHFDEVLKKLTKDPTNQELLQEIKQIQERFLKI